MRTKPGNIYQDGIRLILACTGNIGIDPRHVEGYMRLTYGTLDALSKETFVRETKEAVIDITLNPVLAEKLALSYGL